MILRGLNFEYSFSLGLILFFFFLFFFYETYVRTLARTTVTATWFFRTWNKTHSSNPPVIVQLVKIKGLQRDRYLIPEEFDSEKFHFGVTFSLKLLLQLKTTSQYLVCTLWRCQRKFGPSLIPEKNKPRRENKVPVKFSVTKVRPDLWSNQGTTWPDGGLSRIGHPRAVC